LILAFVVFNPGDLYYLGYKKTTTIIIIIAMTMFMVLSSSSKSLREFTRFI